MAKEAKESKTYYLGTGRRKRAVARVFLRSGKGTITVNGRTFENYFPSEAARAIVRQPLCNPRSSRCRIAFLVLPLPP